VVLAAFAVLVMVVLLMNINVFLLKKLLLLLG